MAFLILGVYDNLLLLLLLFFYIFILFFLFIFFLERRTSELARSLQRSGRRITEQTSLLPEETQEIRGGTKKSPREVQQNKVRIHADCCLASGHKSA